MQKKLTNHEVYQPAEDTFFFANHLEHESGETALDIGTGSGYLAKILSPNFSFVVVTDINFNALIKQKTKFSNSVCCDGADAFNTQFDLIVCNMPYLPAIEISDHSVDGGHEGLEVSWRIIKSASKRLKKNGKFLFLTSSIANYQKLLDETKKLGFNVKILARKKLFFEELILIETRIQ